MCVYLYLYLYLYRSVALSNFSKFPLSIFFHCSSLISYVSLTKKRMYSIIIYNNNDIVHVHNHIQRAEEEDEECVYDMELHGRRGDPIWVSTRSSHCSGPLRCNSIQQGVDVTVCRRYSAPQPFTKDMRMVHMRVS